MIHRHLTIVSLIGLSACVLTECPSFAYIEASNNTPTVLTIEELTLERGITLKPGQTARFRFGGVYIKVKSERGTLNYPRNIPLSSEYGGLLRIQINLDGVIYTLKTGDPPLYRIFPSSPMAIRLRALRKAMVSLPHAWMSYKRERGSS